MFLKKTIERNPQLIEHALKLHQEEQILPDSFVIDLDTLLDNARKILDKAKKHQFKMYFMLKQLGRNPYIAKELVNLGYAGAVAVDFKEALVYMENNIPIGNVGHLVQPPKQMLEKLVNYGCEFFTIYSLKKAQDLNNCLLNSNKKQKIMLRIIHDDDKIYSGQNAGIKLSELKFIVKELLKLEHIEIKGITSFPCFLYNEETAKIEPTQNLFTILKAKEIIESFGIVVENVNAPSTTSVETIEAMSHYPVNSGEPGHGLSGSTPLHANQDCIETPCVVYISEISHNVGNNAYCFGGGYYRRSHVENALVGNSLHNLKKAKVITPDFDSIDYHFGLDQKFNINDTVIMAFRFQIFVTRSNVYIVRGLKSLKPKIVGVYNSLGGKL